MTTPNPGLGRPLEQRLLEGYGERCPDYCPGCAVCDMWHMWDVHAYSCIEADMVELAAWVADNGIDLDTYELPIPKVDPADYQGWLTIEGGTDQ